MPQQTRAGHGAAPDETARLAGGPLVGPPPPNGAVPAAHGQSTLHGQPPPITERRWEPAAEIPQQPTAQEPPAPGTEPSADEPVAQEPAEPSAEQPSAEQPVAQEAAAEESTAGFASGPDDTRPFFQQWMTVSAETAPEPAASPAEAPLATAAGEAGPAPETAGTDHCRPTQMPATFAEIPAARPDAPEQPELDATTVLPADRDAGTPPATPPPPPTGEDTGDGGGPRRPWWRRPAVLTPAAAVVLLAGAYGVDLLISSGDVPRNTMVAGVDIGGLSPAGAATTLEQQLGPLVSADHTVVADDVSTTLSPANAGITLDVDATVGAAADQPLNPWTRLTSFFTERDVTPVLATDRGALDAQLEAIAGQVDVAPVEATITLDGTSPQLVQPVDGRSLDRAGSADAISTALASDADPADPIELPVEVAAPNVDAAEAQRVLDETVTPALSAPVELVSDDGATSVDVPAAAIAASLTFTPQDDGQLAVTLDPAKLQGELGDELGAFGTPAKDATFKIAGDSISVVPSVDGTGVDPAALVQQLLPVLTAPAPRTLTAQLGPVPADFTTEQAKSLGIVEKVSSFTTNFTNPTSGTNIRVVAAEVDGAIVRPGETFSLNSYTSPRGTAQGYVPAPVISGGQLVQAVGGGVSQFATTMFNAVFFAGVEDVYHKPHSFYISRYPAGREATVFEGQIDLVWKNDTDTGIYVQTQWTPGSLTVTFWGTKHYDIESVSGERRNLRQPAVQEKVDDGNCIPQSGSTGFDITVTRVFRDLNGGAEIRRENFNTHYAAEAIIRCVPPAPATPEGSAPPSTPAPGGRRPGGRRSS